MVAVQDGDTLQAKFISSFLRAGRVLAISDDAKQISAIAQKVKSSHKSGKKFSNMTVQLQAFVVTVWSREPSAQLHLVLQLTMQDASQRACRIYARAGRCWFCYLVIWTGSAFFFQPILVLLTENNCGRHLRTSTCILGRLLSAQGNQGFEKGSQLQN
jgi:hypothetical protein